MKPSPELFNLIKSLTKSEKRYFKLSSSLQSGEKNYMKLFDAIEEQEEYAEEDLKLLFKGETFINHLPSEKNHLYSLILKSLRGFYSDKSAASILQEQLRNIELLYNKALYKECAKTIKKAKKIAYNYEKYYFLLDLIDWEKILIEEEYLRGKFNTNLNNLIDEEKDCLEKLRNIAEYQKLYSQIDYVFRKGGYTRNEDGQKIVDEIANHHLIVGKNTALTTKAATACYYVKGLCAVTERNIAKAALNFNKVIKIMEDNPTIMKELPKRYIKALNNILHTYFDANEWDNCLTMINKMRSLHTKNGFESLDIQLNLFTLPSNAELLFYIYQGNYKYAIAHVVPKIIAGISSFKGKMNNEDEMLFYYNISRLYFGDGDFKMALKYSNKMLNNSAVGLREDVYVFARLLNLVIHYELGNFDLLGYTIKSTKRFVAKNKRNFQFEFVFLQGLKRLIKVKNTAELPLLYTNFKAEMEEVLKDPYEKVAIKYFDFMAWIDSKIEKKSFVELIKSKS